MIERLALAAMGTRFEIALSGASPAALRAAGEAALDEVSELHARWSTFDPGSLVARVNRLAAGRAVPLDGDTLAILRIARDLWRETGGRFDPTVGARMRALGFRGSTTVGADGPVGPGMTALELDESAGTVRFHDDRLELDLGAIAKGYALDRAAESLRESGVPCALLHGGTSSVVAVGAPPDAGGWPIALDAAGHLPQVVLRDAALAVSTCAGRVATDDDAEDGDGAPRGHVIDPSTGHPAPLEGWAAVVADDATRADAWATALAVSVPDDVPADISCATGSSPDRIDHRRDPRGAFHPRSPRAGSRADATPDPRSDR